jgi:diguanylate cyclase (GGDEF)-like protein
METTYRGIKGMNDTAKLHRIDSTGEKWQEIDKVMVELDHFKRQSERLNLMNNLHGRIAGVLNLAGMIEAYSVWLMPLVEHELIGYSNNTRKKKHLFCSGHGPNRRRAIAFAEELIKKNPQAEGVYNDGQGHFGHKWVFESAGESGLFLILKDGRVLSEDEIDLITDSLTILSDSLQRGLEYEDLFRRASHDALTGLYNRRVFDERILGMMDSARRYNRPLTMLSMDLDHFKEINDNLGHQRGDEVLVAVADVLQDAVRSTDLLVRMGGDEFIVVLADNDKNSGQVLAERLCKAVDGLDIWADKTTKLGISIGLAQLQEQEDLMQWLERADEILYHAKDEGRYRVAVR